MLLELIDEPDQAIEGFLMDPGFAAIDRLQHVLAELGRLLP